MVIDMNMFDIPKCDLCNVSFKHNAQLDLHMTNVHSEDEYTRLERIRLMATKAVNVQKTSDKNTGKINHIKRGKNNDCSECGMVFENEEDYNIHIKEKQNAVSQTQEGEDHEYVDVEDEMKFRN